MTTSGYSSQQNNFFWIIWTKKWFVFATGAGGLLLGLTIALFLDKTYVAEAILIPPKPAVQSEMMPLALPESLGSADSLHRKLTSGLLRLNLSQQLRSFSYRGDEEFGDNLDERLSVEVGEDNNEITVRYRRASTQDQVVTDLGNLVERANQIVLVDLQYQFEQQIQALIQETQNKIERLSREVAEERRQEIVLLRDELDSLQSILDESANGLRGLNNIILSPNSKGDIRVPLHLLSRQSLEARSRQVRSLIAQLQSDKDVNSYVDEIPAFEARLEDLRLFKINIITGSTYRYERPPSIDRAATSPKPLLLALAGLLTGCLAGVLGAVVVSSAARQDHDA